MYAVDVDPHWLTDTVTLAKRTGMDDWQKPTYGDPVTVPNVRIDRSTVYSGDSNSRTIVANAVVYIYTKYAGEMPVLDDLWLNGTCTYDGRPHIIKTVSRMDAPGEPIIWGYELEVL